MKLNRVLCVLCLTVTVLFTGCTSKAVYEDYHNEVNALYEKIVSTDAKINNIDTESEESVESMFESLESLRLSFSDFAAIDPPEEFADCQYLAENAAKYVEISEQYFHEALDGEYDDTSFKNGIANYNEVVKCVNYMGDVLQNKAVEKQVLKKNCINAILFLIFRTIN